MRQQEFNPEYNLLQEIFDYVWYKIFPPPKDLDPLSDYRKAFPILPDKIPYEPQKRTHASGISITIGKTYNDKPVTLELKEQPHSYICGTTGSGKSVTTKSILTSLVTTYSPKELELYLCDLKRVELNLFRNVEHTKTFVWTVQDTTKVIYDLLAETNRRYDLFMQHGVTDIFQYNKLPNVKKLKYQILFIEEIVLLLEDNKKVAMKLLKQLIAISRASGLYVFLTTQRPDNTVIDNVVKANINNRIVLKTEDSKNSIVALDSPGAELLKGNGEAYLKRGAEIIHFRGYYISDNYVKTKIKGSIKPSVRVKDKTQGEENKTSENGVKQVDLSFIENL